MYNRPIIDTHARLWNLEPFNLSWLAVDSSLFHQIPYSHGKLHHLLDTLPFYFDTSSPP